MSFIKQTYEYGNNKIPIGYFELILIVDAVINIEIHIYILIFSPNISLLNVVQMTVSIPCEVYPNISN